jgi:hypothetical protein
MCNLISKAAAEDAVEEGTAVAVDMEVEVAEATVEAAETVIKVSLVILGSLYLDSAHSLSQV